MKNLLKRLFLVVNISAAALALSACMSSVDMQQPTAQLHRQLNGTCAYLKQDSHKLVVILPSDNSFYPRTGRLTPRAINAVAQVVNTMHKYPALHVKITGYMDNHNRPKTSQLVSLKHAMVVADYFRNHGIDSGRIEMSGMGSANPIANNATSQGRVQNRRVEMMLFEP